MSDFLGGICARRASAVLTVAIAHSLSLVLLVIVAVATHAAWPGDRLMVWAVITGLSGGLAAMAFYRSLAMGEMGLSAALAGLLTAVLPVVFSFFAEGRPKPTQLIGFGLAGLAILCISYQPSPAAQAADSNAESGEGNAESQERRKAMSRHGLALAAVAGVGFGVFLISSKYASEGAVVWPLALSRLSSAGLAMILLEVSQARGKHKASAAFSAVEKSAAAAGSARQWNLTIFLLAGSAGLLEAVGNLVYMVATQLGRLDVAAVLSSLYPAVTILLALWILKERAGKIQAWGMILALVAVGFISR